MAILTILAEGSRFALLGDEAGEIIPLLKADLHKLSGGYKLPELIPCPPEDAPRIGSYRLTITLGDGLPPDAIIRFEYYRDEMSGITIYKAFYEPLRRWYVRELRDEQGKPTGNYYRED